MSNIALFKSGNLAIPAYLRAGTDDITKALAGSSGVKTISIRGGVWRLMDGQNEIAKNEERSMNLIVLAAAPKVGRVWYAGKYDENAKEPAQPSCWSADGDKPNPEVPAATRQSDKCQTCPQNIQGSGEGTSRSCRFQQRLAVALENDADKNVYRLQLPAKSIFGKPEGGKMPLQAYAKFLAGHSVPITGVVTEARFNTAEAVPVLTFSAVRPLTEDEYNDAREMADTEDAKTAVEFHITIRDTAEAPAASEYQEEVPQPKPVKAAKPAPVTAEPDADDEPVAEPVKRASKKSAPTPVEDVQEAKKGAADILSAWGDDDE